MKIVDYDELALYENKRISTVVDSSRSFTASSFMRIKEFLLL